MRYAQDEKRQEIMGYMGNKVLILYYHKIIKIEQDLNKLSITPDLFERQIKYLKDHYNIINMEDIGKGNSDLSVVITFDDGYEDNYINALPILEKYKVPATIFVSTGKMNTDEELWHDEIVRLILMGGYYPKKFCTYSTPFSFEFDTTGYYQRAELYRVMRYILPHISNQHREKILDDLYAWADQKRSGRTTHRILSTQQLQELSKSRYITIGAHTVNHCSLGFMTEEEQYEEIKQSKDQIESIIDRRVTLFSYPFGNRGDYNSKTIEILKQQGFVMAANTIHTVLDESNFNCYEIPRMVVQSYDILEFQGMIESCFQAGGVAGSAKECRLAYVGRLEDDEKLINGGEMVIVWGMGKKGQLILGKLRQYLSNDRIIKLCDSNKTYQCDCYPDGLGEYKNAVIILAFDQIEAAFEQIEKYGLRNIHYYV